MHKSIKALVSIFYCDSDLEKQIRHVIGFRPRNIEYYKLALVHRSASFIAPGGSTINNERLEFLGDAVLGVTIAEHLYLKYPDMSEGELTKLRSRFVNGNNLEKFCKESGIDKLIVTRADLRKSIHITGDAVEALIGAIYLDRGAEKAKQFILKKFLTSCMNIQNGNNAEYNYKSEVIEWCQHNKFEYRFDTNLHPTSSNHKPLFICNLRVGERIFGVGTGRSKKDAEQSASREALYGFQ
jgi:ribonuclease-3